MKNRSREADDRRKKRLLSIGPRGVPRVTAMIGHPILALSFVLPGSGNIPRMGDQPAYMTIAAEELLAKVQSGQPLFLIDCRPTEEYCAGHVPRAVNVSMDSFSFGKDTVLRRSIEDIQKQIGKTLSFVLIDGETQEEYMPRSKLEELMNHLPYDRDREIIFYCRRPECTRSPTAIRWAEALGFKNVWRYEGGWKEWSEKNYLVER